MVKKRKRLTAKPSHRKHQWTADDVIKDLLDSGAIEISPEEMKKEPYVTYMKNIKRDGKFICD
jgi:hypothetical protein